jgi:hypothetical protein
MLPVATYVLIRYCNVWTGIVKLCFYQVLAVERTETISSYNMRCSILWQISMRCSSFSDAAPSVRLSSVGKRAPTRLWPLKYSKTILHTPDRSVHKMLPFDSMQMYALSKCVENCFDVVTTDNNKCRICSL